MSRNEETKEQETTKIINELPPFNFELDLHWNDSMLTITATSHLNSYIKFKSSFDEKTLKEQNFPSNNIKDITQFLRMALKYPNKNITVSYGYTKECNLSKINEKALNKTYELALYMHDDSIC